MAHMTPPDATNWIRSAALINQDAIDSVVAQLDLQLDEVMAWPDTPAKGTMRDVLTRLKACYRSVRARNVSAIRVADGVLAMFGAGAVDTPVAPTTWSTGDW